MNVPRAITAEFSGASTVSRDGVTNGAAAGLGIAPGSVASIFGGNLAGQSAIAPSGSPAKTLSGVSVQIGERTMPLLFVSPEQINFQVPADLAPGAHTLTVSSAGMPGTTAEFTILRDAPGVFPAVIDGHTYAMAMHEDGTPVTEASPAKAGELLTLYGTGFGPTDHARPEAAAAPAKPPYRLLDPVTIQVSGAAITPESAFAAPGQVGVDAVQFRLDSGVGTGSLELSVTVNGVVSNTLALPVGN
jgi:uncharacterized protein (TIGR03437 family)